ncbi:uncharacterized protein LOC143524273 isoform X2 [Brachyhypopomus gauderio]|uniref:uncharacterized protein LOC143524273 isoform X2 n=1 Tax=Brachyhypopomus gauderio TaxID=698409 RepID=UPI00404139E7
MKRLQNVRTPRKSRSSENNKSSSGMNKNTAKRQHLEFGSGSIDNLSSMSADVCDADSSGSIVLNKSPFRSSTPETSEHDEGADQNGQESQQTQARHYRTLQEIYKTKKPNKSAVSQLLYLEFQSGRAFIDADVMKEQDRPTKIFEAYPCFKEINHVMDELGRILQPSNQNYVTELRKWWKVLFCSKIQFYGVMKKVMKPPMTLDEVHQSIEILKALPALFPSGVAPPKKLGQK